MRVVVVGAGVLGASVTYHLARAGAEVVVVDQGHDGRATAAGAGIICPWVAETGDAAFTALYTGGARYYADLTAALGDPAAFGYRRSGALCVSRDPAELDAIEHVAQSWTAKAPEIGAIERLGRAEARSLFPPLAHDLAAVRIGGGARVDGRKLAAALLTAAAAHGARLISGQAALVATAGRATGVRIQGERLPDERPPDERLPDEMAQGEMVPADAVVATAGAWGAELLQPLGMALPVTPQRGQILHLRLPGQDTRDWPVILPPGSHYLLAFDDSRVVAGATRESGVGFDYRVTAGGQAELLREALGIAPGLGSATIIETRIGFRPAGPGLRPLLGWVSGVEGLAVGNGLGASGLTMGPYAGKLLADLVLGRSVVDLAAFDPMRPAASPDMPIPALR
jgi:D-amino-acid dehydrogenase